MIYTSESVKIFKMAAGNQQITITVTCYIFWIGNSICGV